MANKEVEQNSDWPDNIQVIGPDPEKTRESFETYARVVRDELPPHLRPEFRIKPGDLKRKVF